MNQAHVKTAMDSEAAGYQQNFTHKQQNSQNRGAVQQNLQNPMIIDKKYNLNAASRQSFNVSVQNSTQTSHRYVLKDNFSSSSQNNGG